MFNYKLQQLSKDEDVTIYKTFDVREDMQPYYKDDINQLQAGDRHYINTSFNILKQDLSLSLERRFWPTIPCLVYELYQVPLRFAVILLPLTTPMG